jgi:hypothetical protein
VATPAISLGLVLNDTASSGTAAKYAPSPSDEMPPAAHRFRQLEPRRADTGDVMTDSLQRQVGAEPPFSAS